MRDKNRKRQKEGKNNWMKKKERPEKGMREKKITGKG